MLRHTFDGGWGGSWHEPEWKKGLVRDEGPVRRERLVYKPMVRCKDAIRAGPPLPHK